MLTANATGTSATTGTLSLTAFSSADTQKWYINRNGSNYYFVNYKYPQLAINVNNISAAPNLAASSTGVAWTVETVTRNDAWLLRYSGAPTTVTVNVVIEASAVTGLLTNAIYNTATAWNGIDPNITVRVYPSTFTGTPPNANFTIRVRGVNSGGARLGRLVSTPSNLDSAWTSAVIEISTESSGTNSNNYTNGDREMNFLHELGHGLKLAHPHQATAGYYPVSIMCQGLPSVNTNLTVRPSGHDKYNLMRKW